VWRVDRIPKTGAERAKRSRNKRRISGDETLSSSAGFLSARSWAKVADNFLNNTDRGVASSNPACSTIQSFNFWTVGESIKIGAAARDLRLHMDPENVSYGAIRRIKTKLSARDLARSIRNTVGIEKISGRAPAQVILVGVN